MTQAYRCCERAKDFQNDSKNFSRKYFQRISRYFEDLFSLSFVTRTHANIFIVHTDDARFKRFRNKSMAAIIRNGCSFIDNRALNLRE
jgi:hypothetical protein